MLQFALVAIVEGRRTAHAVRAAPNALHAVAGSNAMRVSYSADGLTWQQHSVIAVPSTAGSGGLTQPIVFKDPACGAGCHALFTRTDGALPEKVKDPRSSAFREVRRVDVTSFDGNGSTARQAPSRWQQHVGTQPKG